MATKSKSAADVMPRFIDVMLVEHVEMLPKNTKTDKRWGYEPKVDGHRWQIHKNGRKITVRTRNDKSPQLDDTGIKAQAQSIDADTAIIEGEVAAIDAEGNITSWEALQGKHSTLAFFAFDCMYWNGRSLLQLPLAKRQETLAHIIRDTGLLLCAALPGSLKEIDRAVKAGGFEGIVAKDRNSPYRPGVRGFEWQAMPYTTEQEFVIGGYKPLGSHSVQSLLIGVYQGQQLMFCSQVEPGLNEYNRPQLRKVLQLIQVDACPFVDIRTAQRRAWPKSLD